VTELPRPRSRREFLVTSGWLALQLPWLGALAACAREDARDGAPFRTLTAAEARTMRAFAARILPSDDGTPGAEEADAVRFVDRALGTPYFAAALPLVRAGLADLDARARRHGTADGFAALDPARQVTVMRRVERTPFFETARTLVVTGTFADPVHGGNRDGAGWTLIGMEHRPTFQPPFGWYDAQPAAAAHEGARA
jgi:gluconate 2-dehydrogenase gamma chain